MAKKKILFINQEIAPYVPDSDLSIMGRALPQTMQERNHEIRTFMPKWGNINERRGQLHEVIRLSGMNLIINDTDHPLIIKVASIPTARIQVYFIDNDDYFTKRQMATDEKGEDYSDNGERAIFFARGVLETVKKLRWIPSLFAETLKKNLGQNFKKCLEYRDVKAEMLTSYDDNFDVTELNKLAIDYSDGVILADKDINATLRQHTIDKQIPLLDYHEDFGDAYETFYDQICPD